MADLTPLPELQSLSAAFHLLSRVWLTEWSAELTTDWESAVRLISDMLGEPAAHVTLSDLDELGIVYCRLFIGPGDFLPLVQSVWEGGQRVGAASSSMQAYFDRLGYERPVPSEPPDHLGHTFWLFGRLLDGAPPDPSSLAVLREYADAHLYWSRELLQRTADIREESALVYRQAARVALLLLKTVEECFAETSLE